MEVGEYLPGQYDQRADSAEQCLSLLRESMKNTATVGTEPPRVRCAKMVILSGSVSADEVARIQKYLINPVDSRLAKAEIPETLEMKTEVPADIPTVEGFISYNKKELDSYREKMGLAMDLADIQFLQDYFKSIKRDPTETEIRVLDTYWSDHCHLRFSETLVLRKPTLKIATLQGISLKSCQVCPKTDRVCGHTYHTTFNTVLKDIKIEKIVV